jgi:hypothetical protein
MCCLVSRAIDGDVVLETNALRREEEGTKGARDLKLDGTLDLSYLEP